MGNIRFKLQKFGHLCNTDPRGCVKMIPIKSNYMRIHWLAVLSFAVLFLGLALVGSSFLTSEFPSGTDPVSKLLLPQKILSIPMDGPFSFGGEDLRTDQFDIKERLERELLVNAYLHANTLISIKRSKRYFPVIEKILKEEGLPEDLKYLAVAESALANGTSSAGAKGIWQFMEPTGKAFDLEINGEIDERLHLEKATRAACQYLRSYREKFGSWHLAASAYNMGGPSLERDLRVQRAKSYEELNLNSETSRYLFRIVALKTLMENPSAFGYDLTEDDYYPELSNYKEVKVSGPVPNWGDFAVQNGTNYRQLKIYNPWLVASKLTNKAGKTYVVRIPVKE
jgi:membrane-bound lytic murein transglycosylase D